jgi:predicted lipoprotein with Yx(FWY)xxD motif
MQKYSSIVFIAGVLVFGLCRALAQTAPATTADTAKGKALVDGKGMTLYVFDRDAAGTSNCNDQCATNWPPLKAADDAKGAAPWTVITRKDGGKQWAYKGKPVYAFKKDTKPGDASGDGVNNVWHIAAP